MEIINKTSAFQIVCKGAKKCGMYLSVAHCDDTDKLGKSAPWLNKKGIEILYHEKELIVLFDSEKELDKAFDNTCGDAVTNFPKGSINIYCLTCSPEGELWDENS